MAIAYLRGILAVTSSTSIELSHLSHSLSSFLVLYDVNEVQTRGSTAMSSVVQTIGTVRALSDVEVKTGLQFVCFDKVPLLVVS